MDGVVVNHYTDFKIIEIEYLSDEFKKKTQDELMVICHGEYALFPSAKVHSYTSTLNELVNFRIPTTSEKRSGAVGELLLNVVIRL